MPLQLSDNDLLTSIGQADEWQQRQMPRTFDLAGQVALAARAVAGLAARANLACLGDITAECIHVLIVKAFTFGAVFGISAATAATTPAVWPVITETRGAAAFAAFGILAGIAVDPVFDFVVLEVPVTHGIMIS